MTEINFNDAQQALGFIIPQQLRIETEVFQLRYPSFDYSALAFVDTSGDMWDIGSIFYSGDVAGKVEFMSGKGFDMPYADISRTQFLQENRLAAIGYEWSLQELQRASKLGRSLATDKADAARKVAESWLYGIFVNGNTEKGWTGLINDANVPTANVANDGTGPSRLWSTKTPQQILRDINEALTSVYTTSGETEIANRLLLPTTRFQYIASTPLGDNADKTILSFIRDNNALTAENGQPLVIRGMRNLETAGASGTARMVAYNNDKNVVRFHLPGPHEFLPAFQKSEMTWSVGGIMNVGGTEIRLPKGMTYRDGF